MARLTSIAASNPSNTPKIVTATRRIPPRTDRRNASAPRQPRLLQCRTRADRRSVEQAGHDVGGAQGEQIAVRLHCIVALECEGTDRGVGLRVQDEHQCERDAVRRECHEATPKARRLPCCVAAYELGESR